MTGGQAMAHKFFVSAWTEEGSVFIEAGFGNGDLAHNAEVIVYDDTGTQLPTAKTDEQGQCSFKIPKKSALKLIVKAGMGHQDEVLLSLEEVEEGFVGDAAPAAETEAAGTDDASPLCLGKTDLSSG